MKLFQKKSKKDSCSFTKESIYLRSSERRQGITQPVFSKPKKQSVNPIYAMWDLTDTPEEERGNTAHLWDYCEETIEDDSNE